ncbi:phosphoribosyltransferase-like protein [Bacillus proteolyticus]|uniref:phosphoribosyltransferase-like protein n=1 Tax=Bacillus proteolyticus TaxID=2026192 RepID=UPI0030F3C637
MSSIKQNELTGEMLLKISQIFKQHSWPVENDREMEYSLYNRFCKTLSMFNEDQQELIVELTRNYLKLDLEDYLGTLRIVLENMYKQNPNIFTKNIYVMPLIAPDDIGKSKSSTMMAYLFQNTDLKYQPYFANKNITIVNNFNGLPKKLNTSNSSVVFMVDDYIGTGDTAEEALNDLIDKGVNRDKIAVISLVAQEQGLNKILSLDISAYTAYLRRKGISDYYPPEISEKYISIMRTIEEVIKPNTKHLLGYKQSEALVTMVRTPNNTFPVYWETGKGKKKMQPPFPRR